MHLPTLPSSSNSHVYVEGDVSIDPSAAIAPGVMLRAAPDGKIVIAAGVCIGMGSILHAHQGTLEVEAGATLGAGVLVVGKGKIGANACIGSASTIWNNSIEPWQIVPATSVVGDKGRQTADVPSTSTSSPSPNTSSSPTSDTLNSSKSTTGQEALNGKAVPHSTVEFIDTTNENSSTEIKQDSPTEQKTELPEIETGKYVYGQGSLDRILKTLFPYNTNLPLNRPPKDEDD
jgi:carbon dioxide concentrating mechanism protein CcmN